MASIPDIQGQLKRIHGDPEARTRESLYYAELEVTDLLMGKNALNSKAEELGRVSREDCPVATKSDDASFDHENISLFLCGGGRISWECPFCGERFSI